MNDILRVGYTFFFLIFLECIQPPITHVQKYFVCAFELILEIVHYVPHYVRKLAPETFKHGTADTYRVPKA